jgi:hypothetical protein
MTHSIACFFFCLRVIHHVKTVSVLWVQSPRMTEENQGGADSKNNDAAKKKSETHPTKGVTITLRVPFVPGSETLPVHVRLLTVAWNLLVS